MADSFRDQLSESVYGIVAYVIRRKTSARIDDGEIDDPKPKSEVPDTVKSSKVSGKTLEALVKISHVADMSKGKLGGALFTDEKGYTYIHHSNSAFRRQLRCCNSNLRRNKCRARASIMMDDPDAQIVMSSKCPAHNHPPVTESSLASKFARLLKKRVYTYPKTSIVQLYNEECKRFPEGANCLPRKIALQRMQRYRREYSFALDGKYSLYSPKPNDDPSLPSTELKLLEEGRTIYVDHTGYQYLQQGTTPNRRQLRCTKARLKGFRCTARASMDLMPRFSHIKMTRNQHNHPPPDAGNTVFAYKLKTRAREELNKSLKFIYDEEAKRNPDAAAVLTFAQMRHSMQRARRSLAEQSSSTLPSVSCSSFDGEFDVDVKGSGRFSKVEDASESGRSKVVEVVTVSAREGSNLEEMVIYQCPYCQKLFDEDEPLEQHILTSHINIIVPDSNMWDETQSPK